MQDQTLTCKDCGKPFVWTASEQEFFASKGFSAPVRCQDCRRAAKAKKQDGQHSGGPREMFEITCANCGEKGEVPFKPRDPDTVLCVDCFRKKRDAERGGGMAQPAPVASASTDDSMADNNASNDVTVADDMADSAE